MTGVFIVLIVMSFVALIVRWGMDHEMKTKQLKHGKGADNSLRLSELNEMIRNAVEEANEPLHARIAELETRLARHDRQLPPARAERRESDTEVARDPVS